MSQFDNVSVVKTANVYFGKPNVSVIPWYLADGTRKSVVPSTLTFNTGAPEIMELLQGRCRVRLAGQEQWQDYAGGESFNVAANSSFDIETLENLHYVCHFG